ncbi:MAG: ribonuclease T [Legionellales bacterium]|nr:ribonuclease T [Legionellales bacterium]|tara:strand:+ start:59074 stop:59733 length:660 start_codon:yes stop_codon:yes gene_type:complete
MSDETDKPQHANMAARFRGYLPVVIDVETAGFNPETDALLEVAAVTLHMDEQGLLVPDKTVANHIVPFPNANLEKQALEFTGIDPYHPFRAAVEETEALKNVFSHIRKAIKAAGCNRAVLVGHNPAFDMSFINAAVERNKIKRNPFHPFTTIDTASLGALAVGQTVLARAASVAGIPFDRSEAHSAIYDAERTAELFCYIVNRWQTLGGWDPDTNKPTV